MTAVAAGLPELPEPPGVAVVAVTGFAVHVPGASAEDVLGAARPEDMVDVADAALVLGRKGLLYKEPATVLALCAVHRALGLPPGRPALPMPGADRTAVVVSSNLGNVHTVCDIVGRVDAASYREISPLETANASSNVIASFIAIRFGFTGPSFTVCDGATSGVDAVRLGARLVRAARADRAVVVGVEPDDPTAARLLATRRGTGVAPRAPRAAAACVVLEPATGERDDVRLGPAGVLPPGAEIPHSKAGPTPGPHLVLTPHGVGTGVDLTAVVGETYGALGVLQAACATGWLTRNVDGSAVLTAGDQVEGFAWLRLYGPDRCTSPSSTGSSRTGSS